MPTWKRMYACSQHVRKRISQEGKERSGGVNMSLASVKQLRRNTDCCRKMVFLLWVREWARRSINVPEGWPVLTSVGSRVDHPFFSMLLLIRKYFSVSPPCVWAVCAPSKSLKSQLSSEHCFCKKTRWRIVRSSTQFWNQERLPLTSTVNLAGRSCLQSPTDSN